jgi:hypothetical protein
MKGRSARVLTREAGGATTYPPLAPMVREIHGGFLFF